MANFLSQYTASTSPWAQSPTSGQQCTYTVVPAGCFLGHSRRVLGRGRDVRRIRPVFARGVHGAGLNVFVRREYGAKRSAGTVRPDGIRDNAGPVDSAKHRGVDRRHSYPVFQVRRCPPDVHNVDGGEQLIPVTGCASPDVYAGVSGGTAYGQTLILRRRDTGF